MPSSLPEILFLGTGTSSGVPVIACACDTCRSSDPRDNRTRTGAAVRWTDDTGQPRVVLLDAGPDLRTQALRHNLWRADAILFTHNHVDHLFGLDDVRRFNVAMRSPIDIYAEERVWEALHRVYKHVFDRASNINDSFVADLIERRIADPDGANTPDPRSGRLPASQGGAAAPIDLHDMRFTPVRLLHGHLPILGFRIEPIPGTDLARRVEASPHNPFPFAWCTDTSAIPPKSWQPLTGLRGLALDGLRHRSHPTHFNLDQAVNAAVRLEADQTWLIHIAHEILHARDEPDLPEPIRFGIDGLVLSCDHPPRIETGPGHSQSVPPVDRRSPDDPLPARVEPEDEPA